MFFRNINIIWLIYKYFEKKAEVNKEKAEVNNVSSEEVLYFKHILLSEKKRIFKEIFGKGPDSVTIKIIDDVIVMQLFGFLRKIELELITKQVEKAEIIQAYRKALFEYAKDGIVQKIQSILDRQVTCYIYEMDIKNNSAVCLIMLSKPI